MKRNKMRLVAVAMSAMLAAGMIPVGAYGEELTAGDEVAVEEVVVESEEELEEIGEGGVYDVDYASITDESWDYDKMVVNYKLTNGTSLTAPIEVLIEKEPTCEENGAKVYKARFADEKIKFSPRRDEIPATGHKWSDEYHQVDVFPTCTEEGSGRIVKKCTVCGKIDDTNAIPEKLEPLGHKYGDEVTYEVSEKNNTKLNADGSVALIHEDQEGTYYEVRKCVNINPRTGKVCGEPERTKKTIAAQKVTSAIITDQKGIVPTLKGMTMEAFRHAYATDDKIELTKCTEDGSYQVSYYDGDNKLVSTRWFTVAAHHMEVKAIEFDTKDDQKLCVVDKDTLKVTNNSCYKTVTYYEVTHCTAKGCPNKPCVTDKNGEHFVCANQDKKEVSRVENTVAPSGKHIINTEVKDQISEGFYADKLIKADELTKIKDLADAKKNPGSFIKISKDTAKCEEEGEITVDYLCKVCGATVESVTLKTDKLGHAWGQPVGENVVAPTCTSEGTYDVVVKCTREGCTAEKDRRVGIKIPRIPHTNEKSVGVPDTDNDKGAYIKWVGDKVVDKDGSLLSKAKGAPLANVLGKDYEKEFQLKAQVVTNCEVCGQHEVKIAENASLKLVDIQKQGKTCEFGSITVQATYTNKAGKEVVDTITVPYWSTMDSYRGRTGHVALPPVEEVWEDGTYVVIRCQICGEVLYSQKIKDAEGKEVKDGLVQDEDGVWRYYEDDKFAEEFTGIAPYNTGEFFVANGVLCSDANGLNLYDGKWYFLSQGQIQRGKDGFAEYDGAWFIIKDGELDTTANGLFDYNGGKFLFAAGKLQDQVNGLWQDADGTWYFLAKGQVQTQFSGVAEYDGAFFVVKDGVFQADYNGTVEYDGHTFNVVNGQLYGEVAA